MPIARVTYAPDGLAGTTTAPAGMKRPVSQRARHAGPSLVRRAMASLPIGVAILDARSRLLFWNDQAGQFFGIPPMMAEETPEFASVLSGVRDLTPSQRDRFVAFVATHIVDRALAEPHEQLRLALNRTNKLSAQIQAIGGALWMLLLDHGHLTAPHAAATARDAWLDPLTGLANRRHFLDLLREAADHRPTEAEADPAAVLMVDVNQFERINDRFGRAVGDAALCIIARRLQRTLREEDCLARWGGDAFAILLERAQDAEALAARLIEAFSQPFIVEGEALELGACIGIALYPTHATSPVDLPRHAESALARAKTRLYPGWCVFDQATDQGTGIRPMPQHTDFAVPVF